MNTIPQDDTPRKRCRTCEQWKPATSDFFNKTALYKSPDGLNKQCIECRKAYRKEHNKNAPKVAKPKGEKKWCSGCEQEWPATLEFFNYDKSRGDRMTYYCKQCGNRNMRAYHARPGGKQARKAYSQSRKGQDKIYRKNYRLTHKEHEQTYGKWYRQTHKEQVQTRGKVYRQANKEKIQAKTLARIARKKAIPGTYTAAQIAEQLKRQKYRCYYAACGHAKFEKKHGRYIYHIDHTFPINRVAGTDIPANDISYLVLTCPPCNLSKGDKYPWEWFEGGRLL